MNHVFSWSMLGLTVTPICAYRFRPSNLLSYSRDELLLSGFKGQEALPTLVLAGFTCVGLASLIGIVVAGVYPGDPGAKGKPSVLRSPAAAMVLIPAALAAVLMAARSLTPQVVEASHPAKLYFQNLGSFSAVAALIGAITAGFVNASEISFERFNVLQKAGAICCLLPLGILLVTANVIGLIGGGTLVGTIAGRLFSCPATGGFMASALAFGYLSTQEGLFPSYSSPEMKGSK